MKKKMFITVISLAVALILLGTASFAWFTISLKPEVTGMQVNLYTDRTLLLSRDTETKQFEQYIDLSGDFQNRNELRPVSTEDGVHWFIPTYDEENGTLKDISEFTMDTSLEYANVSMVDENGHPLTGEALNAARKKGYYLYTDFWMMTEEENGARVRLSVPNAQALVPGSGFALDQSEINAGVYGTYVVPKYTQTDLTEDGSGNTVLKERTQQPENAVRIGFLLNPDNAAHRDFVIYEPNAGSHGSTSALVDPVGEPVRRENYIIGGDGSAEDRQDGNYCVTQPIGLEDGVVSVVNYRSSDKMIVQNSTFWDQTKVVSRLQAGSTPNSNDIGAFGDFLQTDERYTESGADGSRSFPLSSELSGNAGSALIATLAKDTPVRVRLFIWIEGQDIDCWNDIAAGSFIINLELAGESLTEAERPEQELISKGILRGYGTSGSSGGWFDAAAAGISRTQVTELEFTRIVPEGADAVWNAGESTGEESIMAYRVGTKVYIVIPEIADRIYLPEDSEGIFKFMSSCRSITGLSLLDTSSVTSMYCMFERCNALKSLDLTGFDTSKVTDMRAFLSQCSALRTLDVSGLDTSAVTSLRMFAYGCSELVEADFSGFDTAGVTDMSAMFNNCKKLVSVDLSGWNTSNVTRMDEMFSGCFALKSLDLSGFDTSKVTTMEAMFYNDRALEQLDVSGFRTHNVKNMSHMFYFCQSLTELDVSGFDTGSATDTERMFEYCMGLRRIYSDSDWNISPVSAYMFSSCSALKGGNGTAYQSSQKSSAYARIDRSGAPGYFTQKAD